MIALRLENIGALKAQHYEAVKSYVENTMRAGAKANFQNSVLKLSGMEGVTEADETDVWLKRFILADVKQLEKWATEEKEKLGFKEMKSLYLNRFSNSPTMFVDPEKTYNAYTLFRTMGINVCPYCEDEHIKIVKKEDKDRRTLEFDHFYPKGDDEYPGLAMCFYKLIPSCKTCNQLKMTSPTAASPYDTDIERMTWIYPDLAIGVNMETVSIDECKPLLHARGGMAVNNSSLALEQRYEDQASEVYRLLKNHQQFPEEKLEEIAQLSGMDKEELRISLFGRPREKARWRELHTKMKYDLIGY